MSAINSTEQSDLQHKKLRQRLEDELSYRNSLLETGDYDWFMRASNSSLPPKKHLQPPGVTDKKSQKAAPSVSTSRSVATSVRADNEDEPRAQDDKNDLSVSLERSKTTDLGSLPSATATGLDSDSTSLNDLTRTATNISLSNVDKTPRRARGYSGESTNLDIGVTPEGSVLPSHNSVNTKKEPKGGFFKKLFGKKVEKHTSVQRSSISNSRKPSTSSIPTLREPTVLLGTSAIPSPSIARRATNPTIPRSVSPSSTGMSEENCSIVSAASSSIHTRKTISNSENSFIPSPSSSSASVTLSDQYKDIDPLLARYLHDIDVASRDNVPAPETYAHVRHLFGPSTSARVIYEKDTIPPHPDKPKMPSAFAAHPRFGGSIELELFERQKREKAQQKENAGGVFGSFLRRTKSNSGDHALMRIICNESEASPPLNFKPLPYTKPPPKYERKPPMEPLQDVKPMKKVAFATTTFVNDPPQQIPSRHPRKGNVEFGPDGELIIHKITAEDKAHATCGIVVGGSGHLKLLNEVSENEQGAQAGTATDLSDVSAANMARSSSDHTIREEDRILAAKKAVENAGSYADEATPDHVGTDKIKIDTPMVRRKRQMEKPLVTLKIDELYTRCCHLREILPIPATLKQIPKGSTDPIPILRLRNPKPSMIEILSFTDFIRIAPIICLSLDGVSLTHEMFRLVLSSLLYKRYLEKLSLRNTPIDAEGWKMLCWFLSMNKALKRLDVTQCPSLSVTPQKAHKHKKKSQVQEAPRMTCNMEDRSDMDWSLLTASIIYRAGIFELILSGCKIGDTNVFKNLLNLGLTNTRKLGLAYNDLSLEQCNIVAQWMAENKDCVGIDLGYNDMSSNLRPFINYAQRAYFNSSLWMLSLNSCNLLDCPETEQMFDAFSKLEHLKYLDISNNKKLFSTFMNKLCVYLPIFSGLARLNFDDNGLDSVSMVKLCECLPLMTHLNYLSIRGNKMDETVCMAMCRSLQSSNTIFTMDFDKDAVPEKYQRRFGLLTMKNMERTLYDEDHNNKNSLVMSVLGPDGGESIRKELGIPDGLSFGQAMIDIIKRHKTVSPEDVTKFLDVARRLRSKMKTTISELMNLHLNNKLSFEGKELLIRLVNIDSSISKGMELINDERLRSIPTYDTSAAAREYFEKVFENDRSSSIASSGTTRENEAIELKSDNTDLPSLITNEATRTSSEMLSDEAQVFKTNSSAFDAEPAKSTGAITDATADKISPEDFNTRRERYKNVMMRTHDPLDVVKLLNHLKEKGVGLAELYKKAPCATINNTRANSRTTKVTVVDDGQTDSPDEEYLSEYAEEGLEPDEEMMKLYDSVLKDLVKESHEEEQEEAKTEEEVEEKEEGK
ncbi:DEKNAAC104840 [Brettanomyces naardenensis]|uniref:DEKNAAC104840 n=1 Tax=Brettanomyces naardenensis TaxID=13370 RepID=A0A448YS74_BRENA|nr:DEKNAAC104840 [Brettanomyces naardenensis]